ncbi:MAG TPA: hypothetical protein VF250_06710 [Conexibacter sp.]
MGRRSRQRASAPSRERAAAPAAAPERARRTSTRPATERPTQVASKTTAARRSRRDAAPEAPWGSFPLIELCALSGIVLGVWGLLAHNGILITGAAFLGSVAGLEVAIREHLGGFRSHTLVLSGTATVATLALLLLAGVSRAVLVTALPLLLIAGFVGFRQLFKRRSGGVGMRVR